MNKLIVTLLASTMLAAPAFAAPNSTNPPLQRDQKQQSQMQNAPQQQSRMQPQQNQQPQQQSQKQSQNPTQRTGQQASNQPIPPRDLDRNQVRELQTALNKDGFTIGRVDGRWGRRTHEAVAHFEQSKNMQTKNGKLTPNTLAAFGVNVNNTQQNNHS